MKNCILCGVGYARNKKYSKTQWKRSKFCSGGCSGFVRQNKLWSNRKYRVAMSLAHVGYKMGNGQKRKISKSNSVPRPWAQGNKSAVWKGGIYILDPKSYKRIKCRERRVKKFGCKGSHSLLEWELLKEKWSHTCLCCKKKEPEIKLTEDHIIPISKGGEDYISNIQPLCGRCNSKKSTKIINFLFLNEKTT